MSEKEESKLPPTWTKTKLENFCLLIQGQSPPGHTYNTSGKGLPFFQGKSEFGEFYPTVVKWCSSPKKIAKNKDILISIRAPVGPTNLCVVDSCIGRGLAAIRPLANISSKYVLYGIRATENKLISKSTGTTFFAIGGKELREHCIPLAPFLEQNRIVEEIEKQFTRLDSAVDALKRLMANLKRYRASVLKAACEGRLVPTEAELAKKEGRSYEPADLLLKRILKENSKSLQDQPSLPKGWIWVTVSDVCEKIQDGTHFSPKNQLKMGKYKYITAKNIRPWGLDLSDLTYLTESEHRIIYKRCDPKKNDVLLVKDGVNTGEVAVNVLDEEISLLSSVCLLRPNSAVLLGSFLRYFIKSSIGQKLLIGQLTGTAIKRIVLHKIKEMPLALPPLLEQRRVVDEVDRRISVIDELALMVEINLKKADRLRQSILKIAFEGKLVPQDPNDEPASVLLDRIREERLNAENETKTKTKTKRQKQKVK